MKKIITASILALSLGLATQGLAGDPPKPATDAQPAAAAEMQGQEFEGVIEKSAEGPILMTKDGDYLLIGGNFDELIGEKVNVLGQASMDGAIKQIQVAKVKTATK